MTHIGNCKNFFVLWRVLTGHSKWKSYIMLSTSTCENGVNGFLKHTLAAAYAYFPSIPRLLYLFRSASSHMIVLVLADLPLWHPQLSHWDMERILSHLQAGITRTFRTPVQQTMKGPPDRRGPFLWSRGVSVLQSWGPSHWSWGPLLPSWGLL